MSCWALAVRASASSVNVVDSALASNAATLWSTRGSAPTAPRTAWRGASGSPGIGPSRGMTGRLRSAASVSTATTSLATRASWSHGGTRRPRRPWSATTQAPPPSPPGGSAAPMASSWSCHRAGTSAGGYRPASRATARSTSRGVGPPSQARHGPVQVGRLPAVPPGGGHRLGEHPGQGTVDGGVPVPARRRPVRARTGAARDAVGDPVGERVDEVRSRVPHPGPRTTPPPPRPPPRPGRPSAAGTGRACPAAATGRRARPAAAVRRACPSADPLSWATPGSGGALPADPS